MTMNSIQQAIRSVIPIKHKNASKGWVSFNAPCCTHNGETQDKKGRGGIVFENDSVIYHCFNCGFKTGWRPGLHFGLKIRKLMEWMGMDEGLIMRLQFDALRDLDQELVYQERIKEEIHFEPRELPENTVSLSEAQEEDALEVKKYLSVRGFNLTDFDWLWSSAEGYNRRVIIPYTWQNKIIGYTARSIDLKSSKGKYIQHVGSDYVFGMDQQKKDSKFALVMEGTLDAIPLQGLAVLTNEVSERKAEIIDTLGREIIVVPDKDKAGKLLVNAALSYGWSVAFPDWQEDIKDAADACLRYGRLYTLRSILSTKQSNRLKIELLRKRYGI
jgi:hypothetical protein